MTQLNEFTLTNRDLTNATWLSTGHPISRHTYDLLVFAPVTGELLMLSGVGGTAYSVEGDGDDYYIGGTILHYSPAETLWRSSSNRVVGNYGAAEYDPVSERIVQIDPDGALVYDPKARTLQVIDQESRDVGYANNLVYYPPNDRMYYLMRGNPTRVYEVTLDRSWASIQLVELSLDGDVPTTQESGWAYDAAAGVIGGGVRDDIFYALDPQRGRFTKRAMRTLPSSLSVGTLEFHCLDFDPVNNVFIFIARGPQGLRSWAYRY